MVKSLFWWLTATLFLFRGVLGLEEFTVPQVWENIKYDRSVDLSRVYTREKLEIKVKNVGKELTKEYYLVYPIDIINKVALISALGEGEGDSQFLDASIIKNSTSLEGNVIVGYAKIVFSSPVGPGEEFSFLVSVEYNEGGVPYPEHINLRDEQYLLIKTNRLPLSAYTTKDSTLTFVGSTSFSELHAPDNEHLQGTIEKNSITFGPFKNATALDITNEVKIVYLHNVPLNKVVNLKRDIWVSHWAATLQFEEYYELLNQAAKLVKGFSRLEHMTQQLDTLVGHYRGIIDSVLPSGASDHYYTDLVGMVSTSQVKNDHFYLKPRYPIYGGWKYNYTIGWTNQLSDFLHISNSSDSYILSVPILNGPLDTAYDNAEVSIFLPEGAVVEEVDSPLPFKTVEISNKNSYFDLNKGHVKVTFTFENLIDELSSGRILIKYDFNATAFYKKPLSIACYLFIALMSIFLLNHINLKIDDK